MAGRKLTLAARKDQAEEVADVNRTDPTQQAIRSWIDGHSGVQEVTKGTSGDVLGLHVVAMSSEDAERLGRDLPDAEVVRIKRSS